MDQGGKQYTLRRNDLIYPELSFKISGVLFNVFKQLGGGHEEKYYEKAVSIGFTKGQIKFNRQYYVPLTYEGEHIGKYYLDFLVEGKIILELKRGKYLNARLIDQVTKYLETLKLQLAIIACFTSNGVIIKRIINHNML
ncbi:MAG: GxxExxY protein [Candidatus Magasanikbacteria bacterium]